MKRTEEMTERQAVRHLEMYDNASKNGEIWTHDVFLHRGTDRYQKHLDLLNKAFEILSKGTVIQSLPADVAQKQAGRKK